MLKRLRVTSPKSKIPRWKTYWAVSIVSKPKKARIKFSLEGRKRKPKGINITRFIIGTKRLPLVKSEINDNGLKE